jgi:hypothetical protein
MAKKRSPVHPALALETAIERANQLHTAEGEHLVPPEALASVWKQSATGSGFLQTISSLKQFGLFDDKGRGEERQFKLSALALDILLHDEGSPPWLAAVQRAALLPQIHRELWNKYEGRLPPQDASIRAYLLRQREGATFHHAHVDGFIERFRGTLAFARLLSSDGATSPAVTVGEPALAETSLGAATTGRGAPLPEPSERAPGPQVDSSRAPKMRELPVTLPSLAIAVVRLPEHLTERDFATLVETITSWKDALVIRDSN